MILGMTKKFPDIQNHENPNLYLTIDGIRAGMGHFFWPGSGLGWKFLAWVGLALFALGLPILPISSAKNVFILVWVGLANIGLGHSKPTQWTHSDR